MPHAVTPRGFCLQPPSSQLDPPRRVTLAIYRNGKEKAAIRWSFEIVIGGEGDKKFCELTSQIREAFGIADRCSQVQIAK